LGVVLFGGVISNRITGDDSGSAATRISLSRLGLSMIEAHPIRGVGANNSALVIKEYVTLDMGKTWLSAIHNKYLLVWAETGIGGLLTFVWFLLITIYWGWKASKSSNRFIALIALGLAAAIGGHMAHLTVDVFDGRENIQVLWINAALIAALNPSKGPRRNYDRHKNIWYDRQGTSPVWLGRLIVIIFPARE
jgi:O-antigen ligase